MALCYFLNHKSQIVSTSIDVPDEESRVWTGGRITSNWRKYPYFLSQPPLVTPTIDITPVKEFSMGVHRQYTLLCVGNTHPRNPVGKRQIAPPLPCTNQLRTGVSDRFLKTDSKVWNHFLASSNGGVLRTSVFPRGHLVCAYLSELVLFLRVRCTLHGLHAPWSAIFYALFSHVR
jgi:hypothetical protein